MAYFHVRIGRKSDPEEETMAQDLDEAQVMSRFVEPYRQGRPIVAAGKAIPIDDIQFIWISTSEVELAQLKAEVRAGESRLASMGVIPSLSGPSYSWLAAGKGKDVTDDYITDPPGSEIGAISVRGETDVDDVDPRKVFVVHGQDEANRNAMFDFLRALDLHPMEWETMIHEAGSGSPYIGDVLRTGFARAQAIVVLFTPDEEARLSKHLRTKAREAETYFRPRPNVIFEAGMALAIDDSRTVLVQIGELDVISDIAGRHIVKFDGSEDKRHVLAQRLKNNARCAVDDSGADWKRAGDFVVR